MNENEIFHSLWTSSLEFFNQDLRDVLSAFNLRRTSRMTSTVAIVVKLIVKQRKRRSYAEFESKKEKTSSKLSSSKTTRKFVLRKSLNVSLTLKLTSNASIENTLRYLIKKIDNTDERNMKLTKSQNRYNEMLHEFIRIIDRRLNQLQIFVTQINEKIDQLAFAQQRKLNNSLFRKITSDWSFDRSRSSLIFKTISTKMSMLINIINIKKKDFESQI